MMLHFDNPTGFRQSNWLSPRLQQNKSSPKHAEHVPDLGADTVTVKCAFELLDS